MDLQQHCGFGCDGAFVVGGVGFIGGTHFDHVRIREVHDIGDAERAAYLNELAAGDNRFTVAGEFVEHHHHGCGIVVNRNCCLCSREGAYQLFAVGMSAAALHGGKVVFQGGIALCCVFDGCHCLWREGASSQIGMEYHARCVDYMFERGFSLCL